ncbi:hypothetical protein HDU67_006394 [Dinochytrium kinnereticum]|nr:hypothetical protein HDU67_006394 [Dinochytrium kinnereticum]
MAVHTAIEFPSKTSVQNEIPTKASSEKDNMPQTNGGLSFGTATTGQSPTHLTSPTSPFVVPETLTAFKSFGAVQAVLPASRPYALDQVEVLNTQPNKRLILRDGEKTRKAANGYQWRLPPPDSQTEADVAPLKPGGGFPLFGYHRVPAPPSFHFRPPVLPAAQASAMTGILDSKPIVPSLPRGVEKTGEAGVDFFAYSKKWSPGPPQLATESTASKGVGAIPIVVASTTQAPAAVRPTFQFDKQASSQSTGFQPPVMPGVSGPYPRDSIPPFSFQSIGTAAPVEPGSKVVCLTSGTGASRMPQVEAPQKGESTAVCPPYSLFQSQTSLPIGLQTSVLKSSQNTQGTSVAQPGSLISPQPSLPNGPPSSDVITKTSDPQSTTPSLSNTGQPFFTLQYPLNTARTLDDTSAMQNSGVLKDYEKSIRAKLGGILDVTSLATGVSPVATNLADPFPATALLSACSPNGSFAAATSVTSQLGGKSSEFTFSKASGKPIAIAFPNGVAAVAAQLALQLSSQNSVNSDITDVISAVTTASATLPAAVRSRPKTGNPHDSCSTLCLKVSSTMDEVKAALRRPDTPFALPTHAPRYSPTMFGPEWRQSLNDLSDANRLIDESDSPVEFPEDLLAGSVLKPDNDTTDKGDMGKPSIQTVKEILSCEYDESIITLILQYYQEVASSSEVCRSLPNLQKDTLALDVGVASPVGEVFSCTITVEDDGGDERVNQGAFIDIDATEPLLAGIPNPSAIFSFTQFKSLNELEKVELIGCILMRIRGSLAWFGRSFAGSLPSYFQKVDIATLLADFVPFSNRTKYEGSDRSKYCSHSTVNCLNADIRTRRERMLISTISTMKYHFIPFQLPILEPNIHS